MQREPKTVVVAGATGYLGKHVLRALHRAGHRVRALARKSSGLDDVREHCAEVFIGEATRASTLKGLCDGADVVFSSLGTRSLQRSPTIWDVDYQANKNLLEELRAAKVGHFVFVAGIHGTRVRSFAPQIEARERIVDDVLSHGPEATIVRPTGFFNDFAEIFRMAKGGTIWLSGSGKNRINPLHGEDLAAAILRAIEDSALRGKQIDVGGPETMSFEDTANLALRILGKKGKIRHAPSWGLQAVGRAVGRVNVNAGSLLQLMAVMGDVDFVGEPVGQHRLSDFFKQLAGDERGMKDMLWER